ncbi:hypothetical protein D3C78_1440300 [compost metagenome]
MVAQYWQTADVLVEVAAEPVGQDVAEQAAGERQQQSFAQPKGTTAGQHCDGEEHHHAGQDDADDGRTFEEGDQKQDQRQPLRVGADPGVEGFDVHRRVSS